jgi:hypothetical protein
MIFIRIKSIMENKILFKKYEESVDYLVDIINHLLIQNHLTIADCLSKYESEIF